MPDGYVIDNSSLPRVTNMNTKLRENINKLPSLVTINDSHNDGDDDVPFTALHDTLLIFTTCNHIATTIRALKHLKFSLHSSDLMIVDDHSIDGTVEYLIKKGYFVVSKRHAFGLTNSWNTGYEFAVKLGYKYIFFINNDVLVPATAIDNMRRELKNEVIIAPMTTRLGAGHNPIQSMVDVLGLDIKMNDYINDPSVVESIQSSLSSHFHRNVSLPRLIPSTFKGRPRFNGFLFGVNVSGIKEAAYDYPRLLFDDKLVMIHQEGDLVDRMTLLNMRIPKVSLTTFIYHFKSVTVKNSGYIVGKVNFDKKTGRKVDDLERNQLFHYHPEIVNNTANVLENVNVLNNLYKTLRESPSSTFLSLSRSYPKIPIFPSESCKHNEEDCVKDTNSSAKVLEIAFVTSNPVKEPNAGDIYTAYELGIALQKEFSNVNIRHLRRYIDWYDAKRLADVDILIVLLDSYDISKAVFSKEAYKSQFHGGMLRTDGITELVSIKDSIFCIAWARNWFHRWLARPWIGNYDLILTASDISKTFYEEIKETVGFQVQCIMGCPNIKIPYLIDVSGKGNRTDEYWRSLSTQRVKVPIEVLRIATNPDRFSIKHEPIEKFVADYAFTENYFNATREIMKFDPSNLPGWKGLVVGAGWDEAPVSSGWKNIYAGSVPYDIMPHVYRSVKVVIDDANHVTAPFGSVNSRVYDALASGALVISNGVLGIKEVFNTPLPTFKSTDDLANQLHNILSNRKKRRTLIRQLRLEIMANHTYISRATELSSILSNRGFNFVPKLKYLADDVQVSNDSESTGVKNHPGHVSTICIGIRTLQIHELWIDILLRGLSAQYVKSPFKQRVALNIYIIDTEERKDINNNNGKPYKSVLKNIIDRIHGEYGQEFIYLIWNSEVEGRDNPNGVYGYDSTDYLLSYMLLMPQCLDGWIMFTNGDNMYNNMWFDSVASHLVHETVDLVAWDFVTHHVRSVGNRSNLRQQVVKVAIERTFIDLGSALFRSSLFVRANTHFLDKTVFTTDLFARDFKMISVLAQVIYSYPIDIINLLLLLLDCEKGWYQVNT